MEDLFGHDDATEPQVSGVAPLAVRMRPRSIEEILGQDHLLGPGSPLRRLAEGNQAMSIFLWGPPGVGKTTIASVVSHAMNQRFVEISAVNAGVRELRAVLDEAKRQLARGIQTVLFIDEVHRFSKSQQDVLLPAVENRLITLIAATTENPSFSVISPLLSRSLLLTLKPLTDADLTILIDRALTDERGLQGQFTISDEVRASLLAMASGDARRTLTYLEEAAAVAEARGEGEVNAAALAQAVDRAVVRYDRADQHYDVISAFIKSVRGSDVQAALHYLARMLEAGEDPRFIARRLMILASEDIGMAAPSVLQTCVAAAQTVALIGMPEARLTLAHATIAAATAPKSNAVIEAITKAQADLRAGKIGQVPAHLRDAHYSGSERLGHGEGYKYAHAYPNHVAAQQYLPDELVGARYYEPTQNGNEAQIAAIMAKLEKLLRGETSEIED